MEEDLKLIRRKIRAANKLPESNPKEYILKRDIIRHWQLEKYKLNYCIKEDKEYLERMFK